MRAVFTVTNDLSYDQRMHRICGALAGRGHDVLLIGRVLPHSIPLRDQAFEQKRIRCWFNKGFLFYAEYNWRLLWVLILLRRYDAICSIDLDTLPAGFLASLIRRKKRVFDAHEYFSEVPEVVNRPLVKRVWEVIAKLILPFYQHAYTVGPALAGIFEQLYGVKFQVLRNVAAPSVSRTFGYQAPREKFILYQGALNEGRGLESAIAAMKQLHGVRLVLAGEGDRSQALRSLATQLQVDDKVQFLGFVAPEQLKLLTADAWIGLNLLENKGLSYYYSLANKFFDTVEAAVPVLTMNFPEYKALNQEFEVAVLLDALSPEAVAAAVQQLLSNSDHYFRMQQNCLLARDAWSWEKESSRLMDIWEEVAR